MADIANGDITYTLVKKNSVESGKSNNVRIQFGNGVLTYPAGGIPLNKTKLGLPNTVTSLVVYDDMSADGFVYKWDNVNNKVRIYQGDNNNAADAPLIELVAATATPAATSLYATAIGY